ncbi:uncharacterized protein TNIN_457491 [Trichonephila inaurata madagascariensis]|uniref:Uncharacterized protein n=1 Tax=Trichonephila inaurata madagascariensis TaxID=2747483 RepID=A0A8X6Y1T9_9ARAC|nr:uncharacterized protein TNIN_457491 [Trichonephila inaurata madagascariensis]
MHLDQCFFPNISPDINESNETSFLESLLVFLFPHRNFEKTNEYSFLFKSKLHFEFLTDQDRRLDRKSTYTEKKTVTMYVQVLLLSVLAVGGVVAFKGFDDNFVGYVLEANSCVSESGNPSLCKKYVGCANKLPKPVKAVFDSCKDSVYPDGFGSCKNEESLLKSEDDKSNFEECFIKKLPQYKSLDANEDKAQENFANCIKKYGDQCLKN